VAVNVLQIVEGIQIPNANTTLYTAAAKTTVQITKVVVSNPTGSPATYTLWMVASGGSAGNGNNVTPPQSVGAGAAVADPNAPGLVLNAGDFIVAEASAATTLTISVSGVVFS
jgi:hypothetical protein